MFMRFPFLTVFFMNFVCVILRQTEFDRELDSLTDAIIGEHFVKFKCVTYVSDEGVEFTPSSLLPVFIIRLPAEQEILTESFEQGCGGYIVRVHNKSEAMGLLIGAKHFATAHRYNNQRYLFLPMNETDGDLELMSDPQLFFLPNLVLAVPHKNALSMITHTTFDHHKRDVLSIAHEVLDLWTPGKGFQLKSDLYPDKIADVKGKKFVFSAVNYSPFNLVIEEGNGTVFDGFETRIAAEFVKTLNGTWEGLDHPVELWGEAFPNGTGTGLVGSILSNEADFGFAALYQWYCEECDCSYPFYQSSVTCLVPRPRIISGWLTIVLPFKADTWMILFIVYLISSFFVLGFHLTLRRAKGLKIKDEIGKATWDSLYWNFRLQLEQIPAVSKSKKPLAIYMKISVYYYFFVAAFWRGGISSILTVPRFEKPINDVIDLVERWPEIKWGANSDAWLNSIKASSDPNLIQVVDKFMIHDDETLRKKTRTGNFGFFVEKLPQGTYGFNDYISEESMNYLRVMESDIYNAFGVIILPKGSPYSEKLDLLILRLFDTGIVYKTEVQVSIELVNNRLQNMIKHSNVKDQNTVILAIRHIQGPIYIYIGGASLAILELWEVKPLAMANGKVDPTFLPGELNDVGRGDAKNEKEIRIREGFQLTLVTGENSDGAERPKINSDEKGMKRRDIDMSNHHVG